MAYQLLSIALSGLFIGAFALVTWSLQRDFRKLARMLNGESV